MHYLFKSNPSHNRTILIQGDSGYLEACIRDFYNFLISSGFKEEDVDQYIGINVDTILPVPDED